MVNATYLLAGQSVRERSISGYEKTFRPILPKFSRLVAVFSQPGGFLDESEGVAESSVSPSRDLDEILQHGAVFATFLRHGRALPVIDFAHLGEQ